MILINADFNKRADSLIAGWPGDITGAAREPELYRFLAMAIGEHEADPFADERLSGKSVFDVADWFAHVNLRPPLPQDVVENVALRAFADVTAGRVKRKPTPGVADTPAIPFVKASIRFDPAKLRAQTDEAEAAMLADPDAEPVLAHGGEYATVRRAKAATVREVLTGETGAAIFHFDDAALRERLMASASFYTYPGQKPANGKAPDPKWRADKAPDALVQTLRSRRGGKALALTGLLQAPTVCADGRVIAQPGYDVMTGLYATFANGEFPALPSYLIRDDITNPNASELERSLALAKYAAERERAQNDARAAYQWLTTEWLNEFRFRDKLDESAAIAAVLTGLERRVCGVAPAFLASSPVQGSGKTTLFCVIGAVVDGSVPALNAWPTDETEMGKMVGAILREGRPVIVFDNLPVGTVVSSATLAKLITAETIEIRILGRTRMATVPTGVLVALTGNNAMLEGDMVTRVVEIYLDAEQENPDRREFSRDIVAWTLENRGEIVWRALAIVRAYLDAGAPEVGSAATRFPLWDRLVRKAIMWAGGEDVAAKFTAAAQEDPTLAQLRDFTRAWREAFGDKALTAGELGKSLEQSDEKSGALVSALVSLAGTKSRLDLDPRKIGLVLKRHVNRPVDGLRLVSQYDSHRKQHRWTCGRLR